MSDLVRKTGALVRRASGGVQAPLEPAASTARVSFGGRLLTWADLPARTRRLAQRPTVLIVEDVDRDRRVWLDGGRPYAVATGWRVFDDAVVLATVRRPLLPAVNGWHRPAGPWEHVGVRSEAFSGPLRRRRGLVPVEDELADRAPAGPTGVRADHSAAAEVWAFLPAAVRDAGERLVPLPEIWFGQLVQESNAEQVPVSQSVRVLRMSGARAVAVTADRSLPARAGADAEQRRQQLARSPWLVEQSGGDLGAPAARLEES